MGYNEIQRIKRVLAGYRKLLSENDKEISRLHLQQLRLHHFKNRVEIQIIKAKQLLGSAKAASKRRQIFPKGNMLHVGPKNIKLSGGKRTPGSGIRGRPSIKQLTVPVPQPPQHGLDEQEIAMDWISQHHLLPEKTEVTTPSHVLTESQYQLPAPNSLQLSSESSSSSDSSSSSCGDSDCSGSVSSSDSSSEDESTPGPPSSNSLAVVSYTNESVSANV